MRKLFIVVLCGFVHRSACSRVRFEQPFHEAMYRQEPHLHGEPVFKREHFFPRESIVQPEQMLHQPTLMRNEPIYANERIMSHPPTQQSPFTNEDFLHNDQIIQTDPFLRPEPILRRESFIRREPLFRRESFIRGEPVLRRGRIYQNAPVLREGGMCRAEPSTYAVMMAQCQCQEPQRMEQAPPQEAFFPIPQPVQQQPLMSQLIIPKQAMKQQMSYQPFMAFPRIQRFVRKSFKPVGENFQFAAPPVQSAAEFSAFTNEPIPFPGNFQSQGSQPENTSEPSQNKPVTVRTVAQMPNALTLAQMSSIC